MKRKQFSLVELLVVIAILAILMTLLFPAMSNVRNKAKMMNCFNKSKSIAQLNQRWTAKHNGIVATTPLWHASEKAKKFTDFEGNEFYAPTRENDCMLQMLAREAGIMLNANIYYTWQAEADMQRNDYDGKDPTQLEDYSDDPQDYDNETKTNSKNERHERSQDWWLFVCDNTLLSWGNGHEKWMQGACKYMDNDLKNKRRDLSYWLPYGYNCFGAVCGEINNTFSYWYDYDAVTRKYVKSWESWTCQQTPLSSVKRPSARIYHSEMGEQDGLWLNTDVYNDLGYLEEGKPIDSTWGSGKTYIPGVGGGEEPEGGYSRRVRQAQDFDGNDTSQDIMTDVEEGRHTGYTIASFFDGHVEAIPAKQMITYQRFSNTTNPGQTRGYLALATEEDDEKGR